MTKILVTGSSGFIGSKICELLLSDGVQVIGIDDMNPSYDQRLKEYRLSLLQNQIGFSFYHQNIADFDAITPIFKEHTFDAIINIAGMPGVRLSLENPWVFLESNTKGTLNLLEQAKRCGIMKFIQASTSSIYGENAPEPTPETATSDLPLQPYAASKKGAEAECHAYHYLYGIDIAIFRFFTVYGPGGRPDMAMFRFVKWITDGQPIQLNGDGTQTRGFTYVDDIARGVISGLRSTGYQIMNLGGHEKVSINELIAKLENIIGCKAQIEYGPSVKADMLSNLADVTKAHSLLGWEPQVNLEEGLRRTASWYRENRSWAKDIRLE